MIKISFLACVLLCSLTSFVDVRAEDALVSNNIDDGSPLTSIYDLFELGYDVEVVEGDATLEDLSKLMESGDLKIFMGDSENEPIIDPATTIGDLGKPIDEAAAKEAEDALAIPGGGDDIDRPVPLQCPTFSNSGFANDACIFVRVRVGPFNFLLRLCCREKCCARAWSCFDNECVLACSNFNFIRIQTFSAPNVSVCCYINGRTVQPFPFGKCADRFLCAA